MGQEVAKGDLALGRRALPSAASAPGEHPHVLERGQEARDRIVELEPPLLVEHHDRHRGERLRHGVDAEDRIGPHRLAAGEIGEPAVP
jgi:hypothetical protein